MPVGETVTRHSHVLHIAIAIARMARSYTSP